MGFSCIPVIGFAVIPGVGQQVADRHMPSRPVQGLPELIDIDAGTSRGDHRQDQVGAAIADHRQFRKPLIGGFFQRLELFGAFSENEVTTDVPGF